MTDPNILDLGRVLAMRFGENISLLTNIDKLKYFIGFRLLIYCDECHDFLGGRTGWDKNIKRQFYEKKRDQLYTDIAWYINSLGGPRAINSNGTEAFYTMYKNKLLISWTRSKHTTPAALKQDYITSEEMSKKVTDFVIVNIFKLKPLPLSKILGCGFEFDIYKTAAILTYLNTEHSGGAAWKTGEALNLCVDMTLKGRNLMPFYHIIFKDYFRRKSQKECNQGSIANIIQYGFQSSEPIVSESAIKFVQTPAQQFDSAGSDAIERLLQIDKTNITNFTDLTGLRGDAGFTLNFFGTTIIQYKFTNQSDESAGVDLTIGRFFSIDSLSTITDATRNSNVSSVSKIAESMINETSILSKKELSMSIFKTMGDFLQIVSSIQINKRVGNFGFITGDIICGKIASLFIKSAYCELEIPDDLFAGISIYLSDSQIIAFQKIKPDILTILQQILTSTALSQDILSTFEEDLQLNENDLTDFQQAFEDQRRKRGRGAFGKKNKSNKIKHMPIDQLKSKLKSVGINVTKITRSGKRLPLTRKELERKAVMFKNLQLRAKKMGIKIMHKSRTRGYVYKSYIRLMNEIEKKRTKRVSKFG